MLDRLTLQIAGDCPICCLPLPLNRSNRKWCLAAAKESEVVVLMSIRSSRWRSLWCRAVHSDLPGTVAKWWRRSRSEYNKEGRSEWSGYDARNGHESLHWWRLWEFIQLKDAQPSWAMWNLSAAATIIIAVAADDGTGRRMVAAAATIATVAYSRGGRQLLPSIEGHEDMVLLLCFNRIFIFWR